MTNETYTRHINNIVHRLVLSVTHMADLKPALAFESAAPFGAVPAVGSHINLGDFSEFADGGHVRAVVRSVAHSYYPDGAKLVHQTMVHADREG
jgi:hypothetical protein